METTACIRNKRTLKRRIRRVIFLCILITILLFCSFITYLGMAFFRINAGFLSQYFSSYIAQSMGSYYFLDQMGISRLNDLDPGSVKFLDWIVNIKKSSSINASGLNMMHEPTDEKKQTGEQSRSSGTALQNDTKPVAPNNGGTPGPNGRMPGKFLSGDLFTLRITVDSRNIYNDDNVHEKDTIGYLTDLSRQNSTNSLINILLKHLKNESTAEIKNNQGQVVGNVSVSIRDGFIIMLGLTFTFCVILVGILAIITGLLLSKLFTIPVVVPLTQLDTQIRSIASDSGEAAMTAHIDLKKRPLREIESLAGSTNSIMEKMKGYNELLMAQNEELEAQNEELFNSKKQVEEAQTLLVQTENMASIGQLTAAITHEINTPLGAISSNAQMSDMMLNTLFELDPVKENAELAELIGQLQEANSVSVMACNRVNQIIRSLKNFSKVDQAEFQEADINEGIRSVLVLTSNLWKRKIAMHEEYGELPLIKCYPGMLNQVFMNLVVNAIQAIEDKGDIFIRTWRGDKDAYISIKDNGCGIPEENLMKIFESGFTTKGQALGMGLGLSISRNIIDKHYGNISVKSNVGEGTEFTVSIPLYQDKT